MSYLSFRDEAYNKVWRGRKAAGRWYVFITPSPVATGVTVTYRDGSRYDVRVRAIDLNMRELPEVMG